MVVIVRPGEVKRVESSKWTLVYGRRKTGKTFLIENFVKYDEYFFVKRDGGVISKAGDKTLSYDAFLEIVKRALSDGKTVVIDEFHRLGQDFFDYLHYTKKQGRLILVSSTLFLSRKMFSSHSALLGFFAEMPIGLISLKDTLAAVEPFKDNKQRLETAILLREPIAVEYYDGGKDARATMATVLASSVRTIPAMVGEIFVEEERHISAVYEGVLRAIANGHVISGEISSYLYSRKLIKKDDPSIIQQYLGNLIDVGIIHRIQIYGKKRYVYKHASPLARLFYYADEKYNISERRLNAQEIARIVDTMMPRLVEDNVREYLADKYGLKETVMEAADYDVDACLVKFQKPEIVVEVKWKDKITKEDVVKAEENLQKAGAKKRLMFVPDKTGLKSDKVEFMDVTDL